MWGDCTLKGKKTGRRSKRTTPPPQSARPKGKNMEPELALLIIALLLGGFGLTIGAVVKFIQGN